MPKVGTHRIKHDRLANGVWLSDVAGGHEISEFQYVEDGHWPKLETLPWGDAVPGGRIA